MAERCLHSAFQISKNEFIQRFATLPSHELFFVLDQRGAGLVTYRFHTLLHASRHKHPQIGIPRRLHTGRAAAHCCRSCWLLSHQGHSWLHLGRNVASFLEYSEGHCHLLDYSPQLGKPFLQPCQKDLNTKHRAYTQMKTGPTILGSSISQNFNLGNFTLGII